MKSRFARLNKKDIKRALGLSFGASLTYLFGQMCWGIVPDMEVFKAVASVFGGTMGTYLLKNFLTNSKDEFGKEEHESKNNYI